MENIFVENVKYSCPNFKIYLFKVDNIFFQIATFSKKVIVLLMYYLKYKHYAWKENRNNNVHKSFVAVSNCAYVS